jgi:hypothetical protein
MTGFRPLQTDKQPFYTAQTQGLPVIWVKKWLARTGKIWHGLCLIGCGLVLIRQSQKIIDTSNGSP